jgi:rhodanese-related sulfurtransferase
MPTRVTPQEAADLQMQGYTLIDVRSVGEYQQGHPKAALNIPYMHQESGKMVPNTDFVSVMERMFPKDAKLVFGCRSGNRSLQAAKQLEGMGWTGIVDMRAGFDGEKNPQTGEWAVLGWSKVGLPCEVSTPGGDYDELLAKLGPAPR